MSPRTMNAVQIEATGGPEVLRIVELAIPEPKEGQVLLRMRAAGLNYSDLAIRENRYVWQTPLPFHMGREVCGIVEAVGPGVSENLLGACLVGFVEQGAFAEFVVADLADLYPCPEEMDAETAVAILLQGLTAKLILDDAAKVGPEDTVLIHAGAGGLGQLAIQIAGVRGALRIATASTEMKLQAIRELGAEAVCYGDEAPDWVEAVLALTGGKGCSVILECIGGDVFVRSFREALAPFGRMVVYGIASGKIARLRNSEVLPENKRLIGFYLGPYLEDSQRVQRELAELGNMVREKALVPRIDWRGPIDRVVEAFERLESRRSIGKILFVQE